MSTITVHTIVKDEENFLRAAILSVIDFVDKIIIFDTGSTDRTVSIAEELAATYPEKVLFEEKGECDKKQHTALRQEMIERTTTEWFMILDGDEVWSRRGMEEARAAIANAESNNIACLVAPFYLCLGDVFHQARRGGSYNFLGRSGLMSTKIFRNKDICWQGDYGHDTLINSKTGKSYFTEDNTVFLREKFWHLSHLRRSQLDDSDFSSAGSRKAKRRETYFLIGKKITTEPPQELKSCKRLSYFRSLINFFLLLINRLWPR